MSHKIPLFKVSLHSYEERQQHALVNNHCDSNNTTNNVDQLLGTGKWWDHPVIASRACVVSEQVWDDASNCITGDKGVIKLPPEASPKKYTFEIKWKESGAIQHAWHH